MSETKRFIDVAAGLILTRDGQLLLAQRPGDKAWSGWWELPGGKLEPGETPAQALVRELNEELGIHVTEATPWVTYTHDYPKTIVRLAFHRVTAWDGEPSGMEGQAVAWTPVRGPLTVSPVLPATEPPLRWLQLPDRYLLTSIDTPDRVNSFLKTLITALKSGVRLVQFREPAWAQRHSAADQHALRDAFLRVLALCRQHDAACIVNSVHPEEWAQLADGIHYRAADAATRLSDNDDVGAGLNIFTESDDTDDDLLYRTADKTEADRDGKHLPGALRGNHYVGMSVHNEHDLHIARQIQADFAVLGHVLNTPSHPGQPGMGWDGFSQLNQQAGLPVFAIGGQSSQTASAAADAGAHGIAGIRLADEYA